MTATADPVAPSAEPAVSWRPATRTVFRFCVSYFTAYIVSTLFAEMLLIPLIELPELGTLPPISTGVSWVATHVFGVAGPLVITGSGSGDKTFDWVSAFCFLIVALVSTIVWSAAARGRGRASHPRVHAWSRAFVRFALGGTMVAYGSMKAIPLQMGSSVPLMRLVQPYGTFSPMGVLWTFVGSSTAYQMFTGCAELVGGILLFIPQTAALGALICLADSIQIFVLNMTYDVPVKLYSFHLLLMSLFVLAPDASRLAGYFVFNRAPAALTNPPLAVSARGRRAAFWAQIAFGAYLLSSNLYSASTQWTEYGGGSPKSPLYGVWQVDRMIVDGVERPPLLTDSDRWKRVIFQVPERFAVQNMDDSFKQYAVALDPGLTSMTLTRPTEPALKVTLTVQRQSAGLMTLDGSVTGRATRLELRRIDPAAFPLTTRGFHWVQEYPFNR